MHFLRLQRTFILLWSLLLLLLSFSSKYVYTFVLYVLSLMIAFTSLGNVVIYRRASKYNYFGFTYGHDTCSRYIIGDGNDVVFKKVSKSFSSRETTTAVSRRANLRTAGRYTRAISPRIRYIWIYIYMHIFA